MGLQDTADVIIIGGGVIGLTVARALARRGAGRVLLLERNELGAEASYAAGGMLAPQAEADEAGDFMAFACASRDAYPEFAAQLLDESGVAIELDQTGTLYLALNEADEHEIARRFAWQNAAGLAVERLSGAEARRREPTLTPEIRAALFFPRDWQVDNRLLCQALAISCKRLSVDLRPHTPAREILLENGKIVGVATADTKIHVPVIVVAAGAWASLFPTGLLPEMKMSPVRGQMLCLQGPEGLARHVVYSPRGYIVPRSDGRILTGSTTEHAGFAKQVTLDGLRQITAHALEIAPVLAELPMIEAWAGLRPRAADGLPVLGPDPIISGLHYATGHYRNGILLAPRTGELIAAAIINGLTDTTLQAFGVTRFATLKAASNC